MKALPKRKGNSHYVAGNDFFIVGLNESPSQKEGKFITVNTFIPFSESLNESPSQKEGKYLHVGDHERGLYPPQ